MDRQLLDYLPPVLKNVVEFQAINKANGTEIDNAWEAVSKVMDNQFLETADIDGVRAWERELHINPKDTDGLDARKARIKAMWNLTPPYTVQWLKNWLSDICGPTGHEETISGYTINIQLDHSALPDPNILTAEILSMLLAVRPSNMNVLMSAFLQSSGTTVCGATTETANEISIWPYAE